MKFSKVYLIKYWSLIFSYLYIIQLKLTLLKVLLKVFTWYFPSFSVTIFYIDNSYRGLSSHSNLNSLWCLPLVDLKFSVIRSLWKWFNRVYIMWLQVGITSFVFSFKKDEFQNNFNVFRFYLFIACQQTNHVFGN